MQASSNSAQMLPLPLPQERMQHLALVMVRRMAAHGLRDARAAMLALDCFGIHFRRPLVLLRAFMLELAEATQRPIMMAPCCATRMTLDEARIVGVLATAQRNTPCSHHHLRLLCGQDQIDAVHSVAAAFGAALDETGKPLAL